METQKTVNLLNGSDNESSKFATRKWYIINEHNNGQYGRGNENDSTIKFMHMYAYIMHMYNLIEYSGNCSDSSGNLFQCKKHESPMNDFRNPLNVDLNN